MTVRLLTEHHLEFLSFKGGCTGSSESTRVKMPHCWKSPVRAKIYNFVYFRMLILYVLIKQLKQRVIDKQKKQTKINKYVYVSTLPRISFDHSNKHTYF